jgi:hypothetical protein
MVATRVRENRLVVKGPVDILPDGTTAATSVVNELQTAGSVGLWTGRLDLADNDLIIDYTGGSPIQTVRDQLKVGRAGGSWTGNGIRSSVAAADASKAIGVGEASVLGLTNFSGQPVDSTCVLLKFTWFGDATLDGQVDVGDLGRLASNWQTSGLWTEGDFDYNGTIDVNDLGLLATNWQAGVGNPLSPSLSDALESFGLTGMSVPEPVGLGLVLAVALKCHRRRR